MLSIWFEISSFMYKDVLINTTLPISAVFMWSIIKKNQTTHNYKKVMVLSILYDLIYLIKDYSSVPSKLGDP